MELGKVVVLILSTKNSLYDGFKKAQKDTWVKKLKERGIRCYFYEGGHNSDEIIGDTIYLKSGDALHQTSVKLKNALNLLKKYNISFDLIYRTNLSSYIETDNFIQCVKSIESPSNVYAGKTAKFNIMYEDYYILSSKLVRIFNKNSISKFFLSRPIEFSSIYVRKVLLRFFERYNYEFASGSGFFLGKSYVDKLCINNEFDRYIDDVMLRLIVSKRGDFDIDRFDITYEFKNVSLSEYNDRISNGLFHYRLKTENRLLDATLMRVIDVDDNRKMMALGSKEPS
ncbi:hypothetical protein [uncultured Vibrio sp.]|uniref:hypothetical protein n=1 Tax=uncultured Vibrio sp. TaxID=114054 RepID=UPI002AAAF577|nr:hypothetical protein [uncultured Vibrio sp.]